MDGQRLIVFAGLAGCMTKEREASQGRKPLISCKPVCKESANTLISLSGNRYLRKPKPLILLSPSLPWGRIENQQNQWPVIAFC